MALCSLAFTNSAKRPCDFSLQVSTNTGPTIKRACLSTFSLNSVPTKSYTGYFDNKACYSSSSESLSDSDDLQSCYLADQIKAKRRASARVSFCLNNKLSRALSQYSEDEDEKTHGQNLDTIALSAHSEPENLDCMLLSSPSNSHVYVNNLNGNIQMSLRNSSSFLQISDSASTSSLTKRYVPTSDKNSRSRCFEYLVGAIDEAWARYCDAASYVEDETYGYTTPGSVATDDEDDCGATTDLTDYESDFEKPTVQTATLRKHSILGSMNHINHSHSDLVSTSEDPASSKLQALKERLIKAKYFLQDVVDSDDYNDAFAFWKRWDMVKYATIELVEDDDDDEVIEATIDELEDGRQSPTRV